MSWNRYERWFFYEKKTILSDGKHFSANCQIEVNMFTFSCEDVHVEISFVKIFCSKRASLLLKVKRNYVAEQTAYENLRRRPERKFGPLFQAQHEFLSYKTQTFIL